MAVPLLVSTLIPILIFTPLGLLIKNGTLDMTKMYSSFIVGGIGWSLFSVLSFIPYIYLLTESSQDSYSGIMGDMGDINDKRTVLFFMLIILSIISEVIRFEFFKSPLFPNKDIKFTIIFGIGWGFAEFIARFLFFFDTDTNHYFASTSLLLLFLMVSNAGLTTILLRSTENTKYVMFATFVKLFVEIAFFGALGFDYSFTVRYGRLTFFFVVQVIMFYLTMKTRKLETSE